MYALNRSGRYGSYATKCLQNVRSGRRATPYGSHKLLLALGMRYSSDSTTNTTAFTSIPDFVRDPNSLSEPAAGSEDPNSLSKTNNLEERCNTEEQKSLDELIRLKKEDIHKQTQAVYKVLRDNDAGQILKTMGSRENRHIVASMPDSVFVSALLRLTPEHFVKPTVDILREIHPAWLEKSKGVINIDKSLRRFFSPLNQIIKSRLSGRRKDGNPIALGLVEYRHLLRISASIGDLKTVTKIWTEMRNSDIEPDLQCYNSFLHACIWEGAVYGLPRFRLRVNPFYYRSRGRARPQDKFVGFGTAKRSVRKQVMAIILQMKKANLPLDEETYINMLLSSARVGSRDGIRNVLKAVWGIDVDAVTHDSPEIIPAAKPIPKSSPLYPSHKLLFAVAHAYGNNSMFLEAVQVARYIADQYRLEITDEVYAELLERAYVLSRYRSSSHPDGIADNLGKIGAQIVWDFKDMLRLDGESPYDVAIYHRLAKDGSRRYTYTSRYLEQIRSSYKLLQEIRKERNHALKVLEGYLGISLRTLVRSWYINEDRLRAKCSSPHVWRALQKYEMLRLLAEQQQNTIQRIARAGVVSRRYFWYRGRPYMNADDRRKLALQTMPKFLAEWKDFLPEGYSLIIEQIGKIQFLGRTRFGAANLRMHDNEPVRWSECGEVVADEGQVIGPSHDALWARNRAQLDTVCNIQPFKWWFSRAWTRLPVLISRVDDLEDEFKDTDSFPEEEDVDTSNWQLPDFRNGDREHAHYVTLEPLFTPVSP